MKRIRYSVFSMAILLIVSPICAAKINPFGFQGANGFRFQDSVPDITWEFDIPATTTINRLCIKDIKHREVFEFDIKEQTFSGKSVVRWNGADLSGRRLPDGVYYLDVLGVEAKGLNVRFPLKKSWPIGNRIPEFSINSKRMSYNLPSNALVVVRCGLAANQLQALCFTPINWEVQTEGQHTVDWNSKDAFPGIDLQDNQRFTYTAVFYELPESSILLDRGIAPDDSMMDKVLSEADLYGMTNANLYRYGFERGDFELDVQLECKFDDEDQAFEIAFTVDADQAPFGWLETPGLKNEVKIFIEETLVYRKVVDSFPHTDTIRLRDVDGNKGEAIVFNAWDNSGRFGYFVGTLKPKNREK